jgi:hypothetical protein
MSLTWNVAFIGRSLSRVVTAEAESIPRPPLSLEAIAVVAAVAVWVIIGGVVVATLGELGPLITSLRAR